MTRIWSTRARAKSRAKISRVGVVLPRSAWRRDHAGPTDNVHVDLNTMPGLTADVVNRWAPIITILLPEFREILIDRQGRRCER